MLKSKKARYYLFPFAMLIGCLLLEWMMEISFPSAKGLPIFVIWPMLLIFWLVYWAIQTPEVLSTVFYFVVAIICMEFVMATGAGFICTIFSVSETTMQYINDRYLSKVFWVVLILWAVHRWSIKSASRAQMKSESEDKVKFEKINN